ncbi:hypothetical protein E2C01_069372 [Portunus trituberculatus]|uniref:Uncharacterized protein n=1 Tax=Portunus trituberculatus TaxID=210409 RepID=A0A5B7HZ61_PORTR|nr:hypothetical protein [Portunus trituberculatus]
MTRYNGQIHITTNRARLRPPAKKEKEPVAAKSVTFSAGGWSPADSQAPGHPHQWANLNQRHFLERQQETVQIQLSPYAITAWPGYTPTQLPGKLALPPCSW